MGDVMSADIRRLIIFVLITIMALGSLSCGNRSPQKKPATTQSQKPPSELEKMRKELAELGTMLEKRRSPEVDISTPLATGQDQAGGQGNKGGGQSQQSGGAQNKQSKQNQQNATQNQQWQEEMKIVRSLHRDWNGLEPEAVSKGMTTATQAALEESLCDLARAVENRRALEAQLAANQVYRYYIEAAKLFKTGIPPNLERVRYHVTESHLQGAQGSWANAEDEALKALEIWRRLSYSLDKIERQKLNQMEHSLTDVAKVVTEQSIILTSIKTEIALQNLDQLERQIKGTMTEGG